MIIEKQEDIVMKRIMNMILCTLLSLLMCAEKVHAADTLRITFVRASFLDETVEVTRKIMEIDGGTSEPVQLDVDTTGGSGQKTYVLVQYDGENQKEIGRSTSDKLSFDPTDVNTGLPLYVSVIDSGGQQDTKMINLRIHPGEASKQIAPEIYSDFGSGLVIDLSSKFPGCKFSFLPFSIPVTVRKFGDGRVVIGLGYNHADAKFWNNARKGQFPAMDNFEELRDIVLSEENKAMWERPKNVGLLFSVSGWVETNVNPKQPGRGKIQLYAGTGWATGGQYAILTWDVIVTIGGTGAFDMSLVYNEAESKRDFRFDRVLVGALGAVEAFGGIGLYGIASMGIYGAGSLGANVEFLPTQAIDSIIVAGEVGYKVKVLGKSILTFTLMSGSYDFINRTKTEGILQTGDNTETLTSWLLDNDYASAKGENLESGEMIWHGQVSEGPAVTNDSWEGDADFAHLLAEDIYPDSHVQIVNTGSRAFPQMNMLFLGADNERIPGNRSVLMNSYYNMATSYMSDPYPVDDNGTADYEPAVYHDPVSGNTYAVWRDAREEITEDMYLVDIASRTEIEFAEFQTGREWKNKAVLTNYEKQIYCAAGADVSGDRQGAPVVSYFTTPVGDPLALSGLHEVYLATRDELGKWHSEKQFELQGNINNVKNFWFRGAQTVAATVTDELGVSTVTLWQNGKKIWEKSNAGAGQFAFGGNNYRYFIWQQDGRFYVMDESGNEKPLTPENMRIPAGDYQFRGTLGAGKAVLIGRTAKDSTENAVAVISQDGSSTWYQTPLTDIDTHALVDHADVAFTNEQEPVVVYSVQNYVSNFDESRTVASNYFEGEGEPGFEGLPLMSLSGSDVRFTDTRADLYIKARSANTHVSLREGYIKDADELLPGGKAEAVLTIFNNGMYPVSHASILCEGEEIAQLDETLMPGRSVQIPAELTLPQDPGMEEHVYTLEITTRDTGDIESRLNVTAPGGHLEAAVDHIFEDMQEKMTYTVTNYGYTEKEFEVVVRDEDNNREISREKHSLKGGEVYNGETSSEKGMYVREGCTNVTIYVLFDGEDFDSPTVQANRICSAVPLEEIYGQPLPQIRTNESEKEPEEPEKPENDRTPEKDTDPGKNTAPDRKNDSSGTNGSSVRPGNNQGNRDTGKPVSSNETEEDEDQITAEKITEDDKADENVNNGETGKDDGETVPEDNEQKEEDKTGEPEAQDPSAITTGTAESTGSGTSWLWTLPVLGVAVPLFIWFIIGKRRKDEEEQ